MYVKHCKLSRYKQLKLMEHFVAGTPARTSTDSRYFANTTKRNKNSFDFTINRAKADNSLIKDLKDFTATFFRKTRCLVYCCIILYLIAAIHCS